MIFGDLAYFAGFFVAMTAAASLLSCLVDRGVLALRASQVTEKD